MSIYTCNYCYGNLIANRDTQTPLSFKESYIQNVFERSALYTFCAVKATAVDIKSNKYLSGMVVVCTYELFTSLANLAALVITKNNHPFGDAISKLGNITWHRTTSPDLAMLVSFGFIALEMFLYFKVKGVWGNAYKEFHTFGVDRTRIQNRNVCLILEAIDGGLAFDSMSPWKGVEKCYPITHKRIGHEKEIIEVIKSVKLVVKEIKILIIRGHGNCNKVGLGDENYLNRRSIETLKQMNRILGKKCVIVLDSCLTAKSPDSGKACIARVVSTYCVNRNVWAPTTAINSVQGKLVGVKPFKVEARVPRIENELIAPILQTTFMFLPSMLTKVLTKNVFVVYKNGALAPT